MIEFQNVTKRYGAQDVLVDVDLHIGAGERVGIVGPNGSGKSTLFALMDGTATADKGEVVLPRRHRLGHVHQLLAAHEKGVSLLSYTERSIPALQEIKTQMESLETEIAVAAEESQGGALLERLGGLQAEFEHLGGYEMHTRAKVTLSGLGFAEESFHRPFAELSGGWQMRAELARTLIGQPDTLLLDEPSNYLDLPAVEWMRRYLRGYSGTLLLISHDRVLLESLTDITLEVRHGTVTRYPGGFSRYLRDRASRRALLEAAYKSQSRKRAQMERFVERFRSKNTKATQVQSRIKMMEKMDWVELPPDDSTVPRIRIAKPPHCGTEVLRLDHVGHTYDGENWILRGVDLSVLRGEKVALVGYNGMGKTTLLRILSGHLKPAEGQHVLGHQVVVGYQSQDFAETMPPDQSAFGIVKSADSDATDKEVRSLLGAFGFSGDSAMKPCAVLSGGERIRLAFARIFIRPPNCLILDEPTTHVDLEGRQALEIALNAYEGTICLVSHDIAFVRNVATQVIAMTPPGITRYVGDYDYYCEKRQGEPIASGSPAAAPARPVDRKALRKERATQRKGDRERHLAIKRRIRTAEGRIETLEAEQAELLEKLGVEGEIDYANLNRRLQEIQAELTIETADWESAVEALESISAQS
jgi:ATP-binding cassette subfamily F protein 3